MANLELKLELIPIPVSDIDTGKAFYSEKIGFNVDYDVVMNNMRLVQLTPPGSGCSILLSTGTGEIAEMAVGSHKGMTLIVKDIVQVRDLLIGRGVEVRAINEYPQGIKDASFSDPDGNLWILQEIPPSMRPSA